MPLAHLLTLGDSWPAGAELQDRAYSFPNLIAEQLGIKSINQSQAGTSADQALLRLISQSGTVIDWNNTLVLFCLTGISRSMSISDWPQEIHPMSDSPVSVAYYKYIQSDKLDQFNRIRTILAAQQFCYSMGSRILFVNNWDKTPKHHVINESLFYNKTLTEILNINHSFDNVNLNWAEISNHVHIRPNKNHPNVSGHSVIAKELSNWIKEKIEND